jgi:Zn-dependent peptidase ImmA (M78 family)
LSGSDFIVPPRSWNDIAAICDDIRAQFGLQDEPRFPVMDFIEKILDQRLGIINFLTGDPKEMGTAEGYTCPQGTFIELREDVYSAAYAGEGRSRFTAAHELGHLAMHTNVPLARAHSSQRVKAYRSSEAQANQFAAELLMPPRFFGVDDDAKSVAKRHGTSLEAASNRLNYLWEQKKIEGLGWRPSPPLFLR